MLPKLSQPTYDVTIPTTQKKTKIRAMTVKEEKILLMAKQSNDPSDMIQAMQQVINNCLILEDVDVTQLPLVDLEYLFLKLRAVSISNISTLTYIDNEDKKPYTFDIDLDKIEIKFPESVSNIVQINDKIYFTLKYPTSSFHIQVPWLNLDDQEHLTLLLVSCIDKIYDGETSYDSLTSSKEELEEFIDSIPAKNFEQITKYFSSLPYLYHEINYKNSFDHNRKITLEKLQDFF